MAAHTCSSTTEQSSQSIISGIHGVLFPNTSCKHWQSSCFSDVSGRLWPAVNPELEVPFWSVAPAAWSSFRPARFNNSILDVHSRPQRPLALVYLWQTSSFFSSSVWNMSNCPTSPEDRPRTLTNKSGLCPPPGCRLYRWSYCVCVFLLSVSVWLVGSGGGGATSFKQTGLWKKHAAKCALLLSFLPFPLETCQSDLFPSMPSPFRTDLSHHPLCFFFLFRKQSGDVLWKVLHSNRSIAVQLFWLSRQTRTITIVILLHSLQVAWRIVTLVLYYYICILDGRIKKINLNFLKESFLLKSLLTPFFRD